MLPVSVLIAWNASALFVGTIEFLVADGVDINLFLELLPFSAN